VSGRHDSTGPSSASSYEDRSDRDLLVIAVTRLDQLLDTTADHEQRLRSLEKRVPALSAIATAVGSVLGSTGGTLAHLWTGGH
jgi:hypothetical protein